MTYTRRDFLKTSGGVMAGASVAGGMPAVFSAGRSRFVPPSDTLVIGLIGCRGQGFADLMNHLQQPGVACGGLCDVDENYLQERNIEVEEMTGRKPRLYRDFRYLLDETDIDAVIVGTPDHWHCLQTVYACEAGKDVYVEKPMANSIAECDLIVKAAHHYHRVVEVGQQQRSGKHWQDVRDFVRSGKLGNIRYVKAWGYFDYGKGLPRVPDQSPPPELNYDMYLGPARPQPYNPNRIHGGWRHQWDFGGGLLTDWGVHLLDIALWVMEVEGPPESVSAVGGIYTYTNRAIETPDTLTVLYDCGNYTLSWDHAGGIEKGNYSQMYGLAFIGNNGTLVVSRSGWEVIAERNGGNPLMEAVPFQRGAESNHERHAIDFIDSIKTRKQPICTVEDGRRAASYAHLGNIAYRTDSRLEWDKEQNRFMDNSPADALLKPQYRRPWTWPAL